MKHKIPLLDFSILSKNKFYDSENKDFQLLRIGPQDISMFAKRLNCYQIIICLKGSIKVRVQGDEYSYHPHSIAAFSPITIFEILKISPDYEAISLIFTNSFIVETLNNSYFLERFSLFNNKSFIYWNSSNDQILKILEILQNIRNKILDTNHPYRRGLVRSSIIILLYELENFTDNNNDSTISAVQIGGDEVFYKFRELLKQHGKEERKVGFYARELHISPIKLNKILAVIIGKTAKTMIDEYVLTEAKILLKSHRYNVSEIADMLNYMNVEEFSRFIKRKTGKTPMFFLHRPS